MAMDVTRATDKAVHDIINDPDGVGTGRQAVPGESPELSAFVHYIVKAIVEEIDDHAELGSASTSTPGVID